MSVFQLEITGNEVLIDLDLEGMLKMVGLRLSRAKKL